MVASRQVKGFCKAFAGEWKGVAGWKSAVLEDAVDVGDLLDGERGPIGLEIGTTQARVVLTVILRQRHLQTKEQKIVCNETLLEYLYRDLDEQDMVWF